MNQNTLVVALAAAFLTRNKFLDFAIELRARKQAGFDHLPEFFLKDIEFPAVDDDLVHLAPPRRIELAPRKRNEGGSRLDPRLAADDLTRSGAAYDDVGAAHNVFDRFLGHHRH